MLRKTRPSSQSYHVAAVWAVPLGLTVPTTAGFGFAREASTSGGTGTSGTAPSRLRGVEIGRQIRLEEAAAEDVAVRPARAVVDALTGLGREGLRAERATMLDARGDERVLRASAPERGACAADPQPADAVLEEERCSA